MSYEAWPSPDAPHGPLPRIENLPIAEQGYEQEAVREAFDAFYRHAAQLDASLKALEAVEVFRRDASELRNDLRSLRSLGFGGEPAWTPAYAYQAPRREIPAAVPRLAAEATLVIAVAVIAGVAHLHAWLIALVIAIAWAIAVLSEWLAARARFRVPATTYELAPPEGEPAPYVETLPPDPAAGWSAFEPAEAEELTMIEAQPVEAVVEPEVEVDEPEDDEPADNEPELEPRPVAAEVPAPESEREPRRWFRRRRAEEGSPVQEDAAPPPAQPSHVRVLAAADEDPWERGFDGEDPDEDEPELAGRGIGRIRRRRR